MKKINSLNGIVEYKLENGLIILLCEDNTYNKVTVNITYMSGSNDEGYGEYGIAHVLEHMLFKKSKNFPDIKKSLQKKGAIFNASTWFDRTNYYETFTSIEENINFGISLEYDRMINGIILQDDLNDELSVIRNECEMIDNDPVNVIHDELMSVAYKFHGYGRTTIGNKFDIEKVNIDLVKKFYSKHYFPGNAVLIISGKFDKENVLNIINNKFSLIKKNKENLFKFYIKEPTQEGARNFIIKKNTNISFCAIGYHICSAISDEFASIQILSNILTNEKYGFLHKQLVMKNIATNLFSMVYMLKEPGMFLIFSRPSAKMSTFKVLKCMHSLLEEKEKKYIKLNLFESTKYKLLNEYHKIFSNSENLALELTEYIGLNNWKLLFWNKEQIEKITIEKVRSVANKYFIENNRTSGMLIDQKNNIKAFFHEKIRDKRLFIFSSKLIKDSETLFSSKKSNNYWPKEKIVEVFNFNKVVFLKKKIRNQLCQVRIVIHFGNKELLLGKSSVINLLSSMFMKGSFRYSELKIDDKINKLYSSIFFSSNRECIEANIVSVNKNINKVMKIFSHLLKYPKLNLEKFNALKEKKIFDIKEMIYDPEKIGFNEMLRLKYPWSNDNFYYRKSLFEKIEEIKKVSINDIREFHINCISSRNMNISFLGNAKEDSFLKNFKNHFSSMDFNTFYKKKEEKFILNKNKRKIINIPEKKMAIVIISFNFNMSYESKYYSAIRFGNYVFGESMNSRLMLRVREKEGLSYGAASWLNVGNIYKNSSFNMYAICVSENVKKLEKCMINELDKFRRYGLKKEEFADNIKSFELYFNTMMLDNNKLSSMLIDNLENNRSFSFYKKMMEEIRTLKLKDINENLVEILNYKNLSVVISGDV
jgi:zinc protease